MLLLVVNISKEGVIKRDQLVFDFALHNKIPILMVLSGRFLSILILNFSLGGYNDDSIGVIADSIEHLVRKFKLL